MEHSQRALQIFNEYVDSRPVFSSVRQMEEIAISLQSPHICSMTKNLAKREFERTVLPVETIHAPY